MPDANDVWGGYLRSLGWIRGAIPDTCPDCYTVADFAADHPYGRYVLCGRSHVVALTDGDWYDTTDLADNQALRFAQSQTQQNGYIQQAITNGIDSLYNRLDTCPVGTVPVYGRQPIWTCSQNVAGGGQGYGCPCGGYNAA